MKIIVDGFGGDNSPLEVLKGCAQAARELGVGITVAGDTQKLKAVAAENSIPLDGMDFINAAQSMTMEDSPKEILKSKKDSSMAVGLSALKDGKGEAFVSAGNTGALVLGSLYTLRCIEGIKRPALAPIMPAENGCYMLLDGGANVECRPAMLAQFGVMGSIYMEKILHVKKPRVGLVNIGTEATKGGELRKEAYALLRGANINFVGNVEARDIPYGVCDVAVADGFTGNCILKLTEGLGMAFYKNFKEIFGRSFLTKTAALMVMPGLKAFKKKMDYTEYGGAPLMGISKPVIKAHGSSDAKAFKNAIRQARDFAAEKVVEEISANLPRDEEAGGE